MIPTKDEIIIYANNIKKGAEIYKVTEKTITNWLKKYDLYKPKKNYGKNKLNYEKAVEIRILHKQGKTIKEICKIYEVTFSTISRVVNNSIYKESHSSALINVIYNQN